MAAGFVCDLCGDLERGSPAQGKMAICIRPVVEWSALDACADCARALEKFIDSRKNMPRDAAEARR